MIDMHIHLLPGIDDGSKSMEETEKMLRMIEEDGINKVIVTPHFYRGYYEKKREEVNNLTEKVNNFSKEKGINVSVYPGQEVFLDNNSLYEYDAGIIGNLANTDYMLVEFPMNRMSKNGLDIVYEFKIKGVKPILAHPERYRYIIEKPENINKFLDEGCLIQINSGSIRGRFGSEVKKTAETLIKSGVCSFLGSDAHSSVRRRPGLRDALSVLQKIDKTTADLVLKNSYSLFENENIEVSQARVKKKRGFFSFFKK
ncbi:MAG: protein-tyrosine-phosphatase [Thermoanaerobacterium thermosaccharolyticum]|jgi:protein-tyrosine phosphatase